MPLAAGRAHGGRLRAGQLLVPGRPMSALRHCDGGAYPGIHEPVAYACAECPVCRAIDEQLRLVREMERLRRALRSEEVEA